MKIIRDFRALVAEAEYWDGFEDAYEEVLAPSLSERILGRWLDVRIYAAWTIVRYRVGAALCRRFGHRNVETTDFVAASRDERGRITDIDGGGVDWHCPRCGQGGRSWF